MYSFIGDVVLDPFLGSGTTIKSALSLNRNAIGYEINEKFLDIIKEKLGIKQSMLKFSENIQIIKREVLIEVEEISYIPRIKPAEPKLDPKKLNFNGDKLYKVVEVIDAYTIKLNTGLMVKLLGVEVINKDEVIKYLNDKVKGKDVYLKFDKDPVLNENT